MSVSSSGRLPSDLVSQSRRGSLTDGTCARRLSAAANKLSALFVGLCPTYIIYRASTTVFVHAPLQYLYFRRVTLQCYLFKLSHFSFYFITHFVVGHAKCRIVTSRRPVHFLCRSGAFYIGQALEIEALCAAVNTLSEHHRLET